MKLSQKKKRILKEFVDFKCEQCHKVFDEKDLEIHRINRKMDYCLRNVKVLCNKHHRLYHSNEFNNVKGG